MISEGYPKCYRKWLNWYQQVHFDFREDHFGVREMAQGTGQSRYLAFGRPGSTVAFVVPKRP